MPSKGRPRVYNADKPNGGRKALLVDIETKERLEKLQNELTTELGFKPSIRQTIAYLLQFYNHTQFPLKGGTDGQ